MPKISLLLNFARRFFSRACFFHQKSPATYDTGLCLVLLATYRGLMAKTMAHFIPIKSNASLQQDCAFGNLFFPATSSYRITTPLFLLGGFFEMRFFWICILPLHFFTAVLFFAHQTSKTLFFKKASIHPVGRNSAKKRRTLTLNGEKSPTSISGGMNRHFFVDKIKNVK